jgi:hypothetical protein
MTVRLCGLLHKLLNCGGKVPVKKLVCLLPARHNVMGARLCCSCISNCEGLFIYTVVIITRFIFCMLFIVWNNNLCLSDILVGGGRTPVLTFPTGICVSGPDCPGGWWHLWGCELADYHLALFPFQGILTLRAQFNRHYFMIYEMTLIFRVSTLHAF